MPIKPSASVVRAGQLLAALTADPKRPQTLSELARTVGAPRATCDSILLALAESRLVVRHEDRRYSLGPTCIQLGHGAVAADPILPAASTAAAALAAQLRGCVAVTILERGTVRVVEVHDAGPPLSLRLHIGQTAPYEPPFGAVFAAWAGPEGIEAWLDSPRLVEEDKARYRAILGEVRARGLVVSAHADRPTIPAGDPRLDAVVDPELENEGVLMKSLARSNELLGADALVRPARLSQISAPIFDHQRGVAAALLLMGGPTGVLQPGELQALAELVHAAASDCTAAVGGRSVLHQR